MISTITSIQVYKQISPIVRKNMTHLFIYILRNYGDLEAIVDKIISAIYDKNTLLQIYHEAIDEPYSFLYVNLMQRGKSKMFLQSFTKYLIPNQIILHIYIYIYIYIHIYIMTTSTNSEGRVLKYTNDLVETILLQLNSSNSYYTTGEHNITFIKIGSNK